MGFKLPFLKSPPPPPPLEPQLRSATLPTVLAIVLCWLLPALLLMRSQRKPASPTGKAKPAMHRGVIIGSWMSFLSVSAAAITFPFMQARRDALGCDALCQGGQTSMRSALALVGAVLIGRASDRLGRVPMLWVGLTASLASLAISAGMDTIEGMWLAIVPVALLNQNFSVAKALFSDYIDEVGGTDADRAGAVGKLGMAVGLSFMAGPVLATQLVSDYRQAIVASAVVTASSAIFVFMLPSPKSHAPQVKSSSSSGMMAFLSLPVLKTRGAQLLMVLRLLMAFAFHMFAPVWQVSLRARFDFGPKDHAQFMGLIGLSYALSQGVVAKPLIRLAGKDVGALLLVCIVLLGASRPFVLYTSSVWVIYAMYVPMVIALGVMNTAITTACSGLAAASKGGDATSKKDAESQLGGLFGVLESVESVAGMIGPALGGLLSHQHANATLSAVCCCYGLAFVLVLLFFNKHVGVKPAVKAE